MAYRRERFLRAVNTGYATLREDAAAWAGVAEERAVWDRTLLDGLPVEAVETRPPKVGSPAAG